MFVRIIRNCLSGLVGGALVGAVIGVYVCTLTQDYVIRQDEFVSPLAFEQAQSRYVNATWCSWLLISTALGPIVAGAGQGRWVRHAVGGFLGVFVVLTCVCLAAALVTGQSPFVNRKGAGTTFSDFALHYAAPVALLIGPILGVTLGAWLLSRASPEVDKLQPTGE